MKIITSIKVLLLLVLLNACSFNRKKLEYYFPCAFNGKVCIKFNQSNYPALEVLKSGNMKIIIPDSGIVYTSSSYEDGFSEYTAEKYFTDCKSKIYEDSTISVTGGGASGGPKKSTKDEDGGVTYTGVSFDQYCFVVTRKSR